MRLCVRQFWLPGSGAKGGGLLLYSRPQGVSSCGAPGRLQLRDARRWLGGYKKRYGNQIIEAIQSGNSAAKEAIAPLLDLRHPSQLYGAVAEGLILFLILFFLWRKPRKPGIIGCCFVVFYAIARIIDEEFRLPDTQLGYQLFGLTRGQWLSIVMLAIGLVFLFIWGRRDSLRVPGWRRGQNVKIHRR